MSFDIETQATSIDPAFGRMLPIGKRPDSQSYRTERRDRYEASYGAIPEPHETDVCLKQ